MATSAGAQEPVVGRPPICTDGPSPGSPPAEAVASWDFEWLEDGGTRDLRGNGHYLTYHGSWDWDFGWSWRADSALLLDGAGHGATAGPVLITDESYSVSAMVRLTDAATDQVIVSQGSAGVPAFSLRYQATVGRWEMAVAQDPAGSSWTIARFEGSVEVDAWVQLVGVFDLEAGEVRLYVDAVRQEPAVGAVGFHAPGPMVVGASVDAATGEVSSPLTGAIDRVFVWQGVLSGIDIARMSGSEACG